MKKRSVVELWEEFEWNRCSCIFMKWFSRNFNFDFTKVRRLLYFLQKFKLYDIFREAFPLFCCWFKTFACKLGPPSWVTDIPHENRKTTWTNQSNAWCPWHADWSSLLYSALKQALGGLEFALKPSGACSLKLTENKSRSCYCDKINQFLSFLQSDSLWQSFASA